MLTMLLLLVEKFLIWEISLILKLDYVLKKIDVLFIYKCFNSNL